MRPRYKQKNLYSIACYYENFPQQQPMLQTLITPQVYPLNKVLPSTVQLKLVQQIPCHPSFPQHPSTVQELEELNAIQGSNTRKCNSNQDVQKLNKLSELNAIGGLPLLLKQDSTASGVLFTLFIHLYFNFKSFQFGSVCYRCGDHILVFCTGCCWSK